MVYKTARKIAQASAMILLLSLFTFGQIRPVFADVSTTQEKLLNWSGFELCCGDTYDDVQGNWMVPDISKQKQPGYSVEDSATWVGLDGDKDNNLGGDLIQAGTAQDITQTDALPSPDYYAWVEFLPHDSYTLRVTNFAIHAHDQIFASVSVDNNGAYFQILNMTTKQYAPCTYTYTDKYGNTHATNLTPMSVSCFEPRGSTVIHANSAEWIVERPIDENGHCYYLANYGTINMQSPFVHYAQSDNEHNGWVEYADEPNRQITMVNATPSASNPNPAELSTAVSNDGILFTWHGPGNPETC